MKQRFMLDTDAVRVLLERRSPQLDQWFAEDRCSVSAIVAAEIRFGCCGRFFLLLFHLFFLVFQSTAYGALRSYSVCVYVNSSDQDPFFDHQDFELSLLVLAGELGLVLTSMLDVAAQLPKEVRLR